MWPLSLAQERRGATENWKKRCVARILTPIEALAASATVGLAIALIIVSAAVSPVPPVAVSVTVTLEIVVLIARQLPDPQW